MYLLRNITEESVIKFNIITKDNLRYARFGFLRFSILLLNLTDFHILCGRRLKEYNVYFVRL